MVALMLMVEMEAPILDCHHLNPHRETKRIADPAALIGSMKAISTIIDEARDHSGPHVFGSASLRKSRPADIREIAIMATRWMGEWLRSMPRPSVIAVPNNTGAIAKR